MKQKICKHYLEKNTFQPVILVIGEDLSTLKEFFVYVDGTILKCSTFLSALDTCFKIFHIFNLEYPCHCQRVYLFIQKFIFSINTPHDKSSPKISGLISYLKEL